MEWGPFPSRVIIRCFGVAIRTMARHQDLLAAVAGRRRKRRGGRERHRRPIARRGQSAHRSHRSRRLPVVVIGNQDPPAVLGQVRPHAAAAGAFKGSPSGQPPARSLVAQLQETKSPCCWHTPREGLSQVATVNVLSGMRLQYQLQPVVRR